MSDRDDAQPELLDGDTWAPPGTPVPLDKPAAPSLPPVPPVAPAVPAPPAGQPAPLPMPPVAPVPPARAGVPPVPPVPLAPTGPGTPSAYQGEAHGLTWPAPPAQAFGTGPYAQGPYGPTAYATGAYGYPGPSYGPGWPGMTPAPNNGFGVAALVLGIIGTVLSWTIVFGVICSVLAIVFGAIGRSKVSTGEGTNGGQALAGLILGGVGLLATACFLAFYITHDDGDDDPDYDGGDDTYGAYMAAPPGPAPLVFAARR
ncbi:hypothetical protein BLA24_23145 [Streptomyces cinnamoneus]|uniref:DUF4190 domain-containing protein n=1 Tax=Streptomyces cinnamoneus TaxID=53446 RepID=A0A2G1XCQ2_STRCJ|nr:DUF4190 domain-containing protein [Streptomyces cinnamoneus]PHQ49002.1 hypothetical protein BLA24_23145 [Streptomyces cinnamoneus]PPT15353.1 DUF4190 domain-containing protein [Streptomyces cinnamoneus]